MMTRASLPLAALTLGAFLTAGVARADEPGPGGVRPVKPANGEQVYRFVCQACHMADGKGATGAATIPAIASNPRLVSTPYLVMTIAGGRGAMPPMAGMLTSQQMAEVATYVRTHFGNSYRTPVTPAEVETFTPRTGASGH
ncbi:cytochrome c [Phenylobacterium sp. LjRoot225]|uniref:c-type cytochrome n=1 Tax=Phenylobacterium sp. LjRoot225 TaxID=3342285 RepID=UPI003ECE95E7